MQQKRQNPALAQKNREKLVAVREIISNLVTAHFPDSFPEHYDEHDGAFGVDEHPRDDTHHIRVFTPEQGHEDMYPSFISCTYGLRPSEVTQNSSLRSTDDSRKELWKDLNRLFTGSVDGETFKIAAIKDSKGHVTRWSDKEIITVAQSDQSHSLSLLIYESMTGLYDRMQANLAKPENADLRQHLQRSTARIG